MNHESAVSKAAEIGKTVLAPAAAKNDKTGKFFEEAIQSLEALANASRRRLC